jgi:hypothetical protein
LKAQDVVYISRFKWVQSKTAKIEGNKKTVFAGKICFCSRLSMATRQGFPVNLFQHQFGEENLPLAIQLHMRADFSG